MKWIHIMDEQPEHGTVIVRIEPGYKPLPDSWMIYRQDFKAYGTFEDYLKFRDDNNMGPLNYWWMYDKDFIKPWDKK